VLKEETAEQQELIEEVTSDGIEKLYKELKADYRTL